MRQVRPIFANAHIHSFEPGQEAFARLRASTNADSKVTAHRLTLGDAPGELQLFRHEDSATDSLLPEGADIYSKSPSHFAGSRPAERVQVNKLDPFCARHAIERIDVLKIDTQGFDDRVLKGAMGMLRAGKVGAVKLEANSVELYKGQAEFSDMIAMLDDAGFRTLCLADLRVGDSGAPDWADAAFVHRSMADARAKVVVAARAERAARKAARSA